MDSRQNAARPTDQGTLPSLPPSAAPRNSSSPYRMVVRLGVGNGTQVFLATREVMPLVHEPVIVKQVHKHSADDAQFVRAFLDKAALLRKFDHPRIIKILDAGVTEGRCFIAEEYLEGQPLRLVLRRASGANGLLPELAVYVAICVLEGLHYAHEAKDESGRSLSLNVVHGDLASRNVFVTNEGGVKISDFRMGQPSGNRREDIRNAGAVLWEALAGEPLFSDPVDITAVGPASKRQIRAPSSVRPEIPAALDAIVLRALEWNLAPPYQSALEMQRELERWLASVGKQQDPAALGALMRRLFANEVVEQRRLVSVLRGGADPVPSSRRSVGPVATSRPVPPPIPPPPPPPSVQAPLVSGPPSASGTPVSRSSGNWSSRTLSSAPSVPPAPLVAADEPASEWDAAAATNFRNNYRSLALIAVVCAILSAGATYVVVSLMREGTQNVAAAPRSVAEPRMPAVPSVEVAAPVPTSHDEPAKAATGAVETPPPAGSAASQRSASTRPQQRAPALREPSAPKPDESPQPNPAPEPAPIQAAAEPGFLTVDTTPWSMVSENGKLLGQTPLVHVELSSGVHVLSLKNPELGIATTYTVTIQPGKTLVKRIGIE